MINPYFIIIKAEPTPAAVNAQDIDGANVNVWVMETGTVDAEAAARSHILGYGWIPRETRFAGEVTEELISSLDEIERKNYEEAIQSGISATFYGWTKAKHPESFFEYRPLGPILDEAGKRIH